MGYSLRVLIHTLRELYYHEPMFGPLGFWTELQLYQMNVLLKMGLQLYHTLLDIECGPHQSCIAFIKYLQKDKYTGIDIQADRIEAAYRQVARHGLSDKNSLIIMSKTFGREELKSRTFDFIWPLRSSITSIMHVWDLFNCIAVRLNSGGLFLGDIVGPENS